MVERSLVCVCGQVHSRFMHEYVLRLYVLCFTVYTSLLAFEVSPSLLLIQR